MSRVTLRRPWLDFDLGCEMQVLSWAPHRPGLVPARRILWREVRNADLPPELDVDAWLADEMQAQGAADSVTFLTSRNIGQFHEARVQVGGVLAKAVATVGLANAERIGHRLDRSGVEWGTINVALRLETGLTETAMLEVMSIAVEARTAAVMEIGLDLPPGRATGTGTDCVAVAALPGTARHAGLHTEIGEAAGRAVYDAVTQGAREWKAEQSAG
ncbi:adenosylcobinamide amidohydrolase [Roseovarius amoyensis]|uniref:adenosylcobinamide amidohydrolase n=1 Tax=Roseovarius amoyensis TaxID=2211448 RepID=UPI000DBEA74F|nr:adenosylcobinamide amidohydrolase [Roseovarius amoyensis]